MKSVVVTGFGPFGPYASNPSTEVVKNLGKVGLSGVDDVNLITDLMAVDYDEVDKKVHAYWNDHCPDLIVHVGVHGVLKTIKLEQQSTGDGYCRADVCGKVPTENKAPNLEKNDTTMISSIDCVEIANRVAKEMAQKCSTLKVEPSYDPGQYLCAFSFYISLCHDKSKALFVHIPEFDDEITLEIITEALQLIIKEIIVEKEQKTVV
ncbi:unnamed protein product, partial [Mesorhabditis belari]|uniref:Pyroglutamyl-peptidase I n=1 Tax=Mesorhabditis belari TaxID=2138241 RepID=A0AAF3J3Q7_9BILA